MKDKVFDEIFDVRDESSKEGIRIVVEVKKDRDIDNLLNGLYKKTPFEDTYGVNLLAVKEQQPIVFDLKSMIREFVHFQEELYTKEYQHMLSKAESRLEIVDGLIRATDVIDLIIEILRGSSSIKQAKACLINGDTTDIKFKTKASQKEAATLNFTDRQAEAILSMPLSKLIGLEILKLHEENDELLKSIAEYKIVLGDVNELYKVIKSRLKEFKKTFNIPRRTLLLNVENAEYVEEVKIEDIYVLIDRFGYTKSLDVSSYARISEDTLKEYPHIILMKNTDKLCLFTAEGNMYQVKVAAIPKCKIKDKGVLIHTLCKVDKENILLYTSFEVLFESQLVFSTKAGYIKQVSGVEFETIRSMISATKLDEGDEVVNIVMLTAGEILAGDLKVIILTEKGLSLGFSLDEVSEMKKTGRGVKSIDLDKSDSVAFTTVLKSTIDSFEFNGKSLSVKKVRNRKRGQKGQKAQL
jgi:DNA gyrase subunit A